MEEKGGSIHPLWLGLKSAVLHQLMSMSLTVGEYALTGCGARKKWLELRVKSEQVKPPTSIQASYGKSNARSCEIEAVPVVPS